MRENHDFNHNEQVKPVQTLTGLVYEELMYVAFNPFATFSANVCIQNPLTAFTTSIPRRVEYFHCYPPNNYDTNMSYRSGHFFSYYSVVTGLRYVLLFFRPLQTTNADLTLKFYFLKKNPIMIERCTMIVHMLAVFSVLQPFIPNFEPYF